MTPFADPIHQPVRLGDGPDRAVVVHGFPGTPAEVRSVGESLSGRGWRVDLPLLPGFGRDYARLGRTSWQAWRAAVTAELRREWRAARSTGGKLLVVGFSMGGALALCSVAEDGVDVDGLVLLAPFTRFGDPRARLLPLARHLVRTLRPLAGADFGDADVREQIERALGAVDVDDPSVQRRLRREVTVPVRALDELRRVGLHALQVAPALCGVRTMVIQGRRDTTVLPDLTRALVDRLGDTPETVWLTDADHRFVLPGRPGHQDALAAIARFSAVVRDDVIPSRRPRRRDVGVRRTG
jgi:carboxylesterase